MEVLNTFFAVFLLIILALAMVIAKRYDNHQLIPGDLAEVETEIVGCEFDCDRKCVLKANCAGTTLSDNGTCTRIFDEGVYLKEDNHSVAKTRGMIWQIVSYVLNLNNLKE